MNDGDPGRFVAVVTDLAVERFARNREMPCFVGENGQN
jgi:hypothetical protein